MILLFGLKKILRRLPGRMATCQHCGQFVQHHPEERATKLTLFFIPVLTTSRAFNITCTHCGQNSTVKSRTWNALLR
ncbi:zinc-ribbon domain-containing protein [Arthrobacter sp. ISL-85]|uniref:zinc-ribbon domain-containing protein n=1 Tax=Arthrobacter sp. ISL-85 TaxID=2819115 RepID=UPI001BE56ED1|nr:zinc-ribbon domain-containing protein [Arthrobacter sp. ISL-85]MBT2566297.1 zinc-ribbon domain-containing protein [Arthrobacter sp. ISL-85]